MIIKLCFLFYICLYVRLEPLKKKKKLRIKRVSDLIGASSSGKKTFKLLMQSSSSENIFCLVYLPLLYNK